MSARHRSFSVFLTIWGGQLLSKIGSGISAFALGVYLFRATGSTTAYSLLLLSAFLPSVLLAPIGGVFADRYSRKRMMVIGDLGSGLGILFVAVMVRLYPHTYWPLYLGLAASSTFAALHSPAFKALVTDLLTEEEYAKAGGLVQLAEASRYLISPVIAAFLMTSLSLPFVLVFDIATFLLAAGSATLIRKSSVRTRDNPGTARFQRDLAAGLHYLVSNATVMQLLRMTMVVTFLTGVLQALFVPIVLSLSDAGILGKVQSIAASGMVIGSLLIGTLCHSGQSRKILCRALVAAGVFYFLIGAFTNITAITCAAFCLFFSLPFVNTSLEVMFRQNIAPAMQGRVWSLISLFSQVGLLTALGLAGILADQLFNPLLKSTGPLAGTLGQIFGTGSTRGTALMAAVFGLLFVCFALSVALGSWAQSRTSKASATG